MPRDARTGDPDRKPPMPSPDAANAPDEIYTDRDKPLVSGSREAKALHNHPPRAKGELGVGTGGDAARPGKAGEHDKTLPPRGKM